MILQTDWRRILRDSVRDPGELLSLVGVPPSDLERRYRASLDFPCQVPRPFIERMEKGNPSDPLLRQVLPSGEELKQTRGYCADPLREGSFLRKSGLLHKYHGRVLLTLNGSCPVHCRYCFRRHFPYEENRLNQDNFSQALNYIANDDSISEVILSGGDPLTLRDEALSEACQMLASVRHVRRLRIHTRFPVVIPQRITASLASLLANLPIPTVLVLHANHANELDGRVQAALNRLTNATTLLNQSVLLAGVNDNEKALVLLSRRLFECGVLPYYLHLLDKVSGAGAFEVDTARGRELLEKITLQLPGYLVPRLVREVPGAGAKTMVGAAGIEPATPAV